MRRWFVVAVLLLSAASPTRADVAAPYPVRPLDLRVRIDNLDDYPDWIFYLEYQRGDGNAGIAPKHTSRLTSGQVVALTGTGRRLVVALVAVPRGPGHTAENEQPPPEGMAGVLRVHLDGCGLAETSQSDLNDSYVHPYRITIENNQLQAEPLSAEAVRPEIPLGFVRLPVRQGLLVLILLGSGFLAIGGVWLSRRRRVKAARNREPVRTPC